MHVEGVRLTADNVALCAPIWGGREAYHRSELQRVLAGAAMLLREQRAFGALILEGDRPRAFGITTFATEEFVESFLDAPYPQVGRRMLLAAQDPAPCCVVDVPGIAERNASGGLQLVIANTAWDAAASDPHTVLGRLIISFQDLHRGYRIARIVNEVFGEDDIGVVRQSGAYEVRCIFDEIAPGVKVRSLIGTLTREQAAQSRNPLLSMFAYTPPRLFFTAPERDLLSAALAGVTDESLSAQLGIPLTAVKARWSRIQRRATTIAPHLFAHVPFSPHRRGRGVQTRHIILQYVRDNPSELTPYAGPSTRKRNPHVRHRGTARA